MEKAVESSAGEGETRREKRGGSRGTGEGGERLNREGVDIRDK